MSLVGTRPILPDELEQYELHHRARIAIKPGMEEYLIMIPCLNFYKMRSIGERRKKDF